MSEQISILQGLVKRLEGERDEATQRIGSLTEENKGMSESLEKAISQYELLKVESSQKLQVSLLFASIHNLL